MLNQSELGLSYKSLMIINLNTDGGDDYWEGLIFYSLFFLLPTTKRTGEKITYFEQPSEN